MDVAGAVRLLGPPETIAHGLRDRVRDEHAPALRRGDRAFEDDRQAGLAGGQAPGHRARVSNPGRASTWSGRRTSATFLYAHDVEALWGVGPATAKRLHDLGVRTVGELAALPARHAGAPAGQGEWDPSGRAGPGGGPRSGATRTGPAKSIGHEETFSQDLVDPLELERHALRMAESVATMLRGEGSSCRTVTVKVKFRDFSMQTRSHTLERPITTGERHRPGGGRAAGRHRPRRGHPPARGQRVRAAARAGRTSSPSTWATGWTRRARAPWPASSRGGGDGGGGRHADPLRQELGGLGRPRHDDGVVVPARRDAPWGPDE